MNEESITQSPVMTTAALIAAMTAQMDALRELACTLFNAEHHHHEHLEYRAERLYAAAAGLEFSISALLETETAAELASETDSRLASGLVLSAAEVVEPSA